MRGGGFAVLVLWAGCAPARDVRASVCGDLASARLPYYLPPCCSHAARAVRWHCIRGMQCSRLLRLPLLPLPPLPCSQYSYLPRKPNSPPCGRV